MGLSCSRIAILMLDYFFGDFYATPISDWVLELVLLWSLTVEAERAFEST